MSYKKGIDEISNTDNCPGCEYYCHDEIGGEKFYWCNYGSQCMYDEEMERYEEEGY